MPNGDKWSQYEEKPTSTDKWAQYEEAPAEQKKPALAKPSLLGRVEKWWTTPTPDVNPNPALSSEEATMPFSNSPQQSFRRGSAILAAEGAPALVPALAQAPGATLLGLGGGATGGLLGSKTGRYVGEKFDAPELGEDVGGLAGSFFGGLGASRIPGLAKNALVDVTGRPKPLARLTLGSDRARALGELVDPDLAASRSALQARFDALRAGQTAPGPWRPGIKPPPDPLGVAVREGRAARLPVRMPNAAPPEVPVGKPSLFGNATSSANPPQSATPLPAVRTSVLGAQQSPEFVERFKPQETPKSRIIQPGTEAAKPPRVEGSYWSFDKGALRNAVMLGDRDAAIVYKQRFGDLPPGASYLTDVGDAPTRGLYRGKE